jgi:hypothetical protein
MEGLEVKICPGSGSLIALSHGAVRVQALCKTSGSTLGYGFPTMDLDEEDGLGGLDAAQELPQMPPVLETVP